MNFLNIGVTEMMVIVAIAILVIGPERMVTVARTLGRIVRRMRSISGEFLNSLEDEMAETKKETQEAIEGITADGADVSAAVEATGKDTSQALGGTEQKAKGAVTSLQEELRSLGQEAQQALKEATEGFTGLVMAEADKPEPEEEDEEENKETEA